MSKKFEHYCRNVRSTHLMLVKLGGMIHTNAMPEMNRFNLFK